MDKHLAYFLPRSKEGGGTNFRKDISMEHYTMINQKPSLQERCRGIKLSHTGFENLQTQTHSKQIFALLWILKTPQESSINS
eukprot:snap_masked-scaffold_31-processed-gene-3.54-mRNA-1 protein AED:1.00 eAED:1.00 QI:0/0/0/0/1/1/2/0/81